MERKGISTLKDLFEAFPDEESCLRYLYEVRVGQGWECPRCGRRSPSLLLSRRKIMCTCCSHQEAVTAHTPMHRTRVPLVKWFVAAYFLANDKRSISAYALARELQVKWDSAYYMLQRLRAAMAESGCL